MQTHAARRRIVSASRQLKKPTSLKYSRQIGGLCEMLPVLRCDGTARTILDETRRRPDLLLTRKPAHVACTLLVGDFSGISVRVAFPSRGSFVKFDLRTASTPVRSHTGVTSATRRTPAGKERALRYIVTRARNAQDSRADYASTYKKHRRRVTSYGANYITRLRRARRATSASSFN